MYEIRNCPICTPVSIAIVEDASAVLHRASITSRAATLHNE